MRINWTEPISSGPLQPALEPKSGSAAVRPGQETYVYDGGGTGKDSGVAFDSRVDPWLRRFRSWRGAFEQSISSNVRKYWSLYRNFDNGPLPGPNQEWRDRTVIPECFKIIETRLPRLMMGQFGSREWFAVEGRDRRDEEYEESVRVLLQTAVDEVGKDRPDQNFFRVMMDGMRYGQIMGHVWFKPFWRKSERFVKTKVQVPTNTQGGIRWQSIEIPETVFEGIDVNWLGIGDIAVDTARGDRRWVIERIQSSVEQLNREQSNYKKATDLNLYDPAALEALDVHMGQGALTKEGFEEPRDTEGWPLTEQEYTGDPNERAVELWLCWDNINRTLTKIANRTVILDHGLAPTPDGIDPYIGVPAVPIPGRVYGESILHYVGPLAVYQTRLARARADEILLNVWQQFVIREGALRSSQFLFRPGGVMTLETVDPSRPLSDAYAVMPRRPVMQEAWTEEGYRQQQAESTAGADSVSMGVEATQKSRDVSATEVQQRVLQGSSRYQMENFYLEVCFKGPLLRKMFDLMRQNMTSQKTIRVLDQEKNIDLRDLERPVDIVVGGGIRELTKAQRGAETDEMIKLGDSPKFGPWLKEREILLEKYKNFGQKDAGRFVKTEEEKRQYEMEQMALAAGVQAPSGAGAGAGRGSDPRQRDDTATQPFSGGAPTSSRSLLAEV
jgi:hypothetical protein